MHTVLDWTRRSLVYGLTFILGFLGFLTVVAATTQPESTVWFPLGLGLILFALLGLLPPLKNLVLRLAITGVFTSGSLAAWFISEPPAASEPDHRLSALVPILGALGPSLCLLVLMLLWEERRGIRASVWLWLAAVIALGWLVSYYSSVHNLAGVLLLPHSSFRYSNDLAQVHSLRDRVVLQAAFYSVSTLCAIGLAAASRAPTWVRALFGLAYPIALMVFDEGRFRVEFVARLSHREIAIDAISIAAAFLVLMLGTRLVKKEPHDSSN